MSPVTSHGTFQSVLLHLVKTDKADNVTRKSKCGEEITFATMILDHFENIIKSQASSDDCVMQAVRGTSTGKKCQDSLLSGVYWQGKDPFPLKSWLQVTYPFLKAASFDTFCLVATQPQEIEKELRLHLTRNRHGLSNESSSKVLRRP